MWIISVHLNTQNFCNFFCWRHIFLNTLCLDTPNNVLPLERERDESYVKSILTHTCEPQDTTRVYLVQCSYLPVTGVRRKEESHGASRLRSEDFMRGTYISSTPHFANQRSWHCHFCTEIVSHWRTFQNVSIMPPTLCMLKYPLGDK
jgi:hypothetical protein